MAGGGLATAALIGCGGDDDDPDTTRTPSAGDGGGGGGSTASPTAATSSGEIKRGGIWQGADSGDPPTLDPNGNTSFSTKGFAAHVYSRLFRIDTQAGENPFNRGTIGDLAESAESSDGQHWVVRLKQGVKFHDKAPVSGREFTSDDVIASWDLLTAESSPSRTLVSNFTNVQAVDDYTVNIDLSSPSPVFLETLADANIFWIMPREALDGGFDPKQTAIGTGPWMLKEYVSSVRTDFDRNPDYFEEGRPYMDGISNSIIPEYANRRAQFEAGNIYATGVNAQDVMDLRQQFPDAIWQAPSLSILNWVSFSPEDMDPNAAWRDERFRQAVSMAISRDDMNELAYNLSALKEAGIDFDEGWNNFIPVGFGQKWWLDPKSAEQGPSSSFFEYNLDEAKRLLEASGYDGSPIKYQYTDRYGSTWNTLAEAVNGWLAELGLNVQTEVQDYNSVYITQTFGGNYNGIAFMSSTVFSEPGSYVERFFGDDPLNHGRVNDPDIRALHEQQKVEMDEEARSQQIKDIQRLNAEQMYYVPTQAGTGTTFTVYQDFVKGHRQTRGYGAPTESTAFVWLDV